MFFGEVKTHEGDSLAAGLSIEGSELVLTADSGRLGSWPVDHITVDAIDSRTLRIVIGDESVDFLTEHPEDTARILEARRVGGSSMWVAAAPGVWERAESRVAAPSRIPTPRPSLGHHLAPLVAVVVSAAVAFFGFSLMQPPADAELEEPASTPSTMATPTTVAVPPGVPEVIAPPGTPLVEITDMWNALAAEYETFLLLPEGESQWSWERISVEFTTTEFGMFAGATLAGDTTGNAQDDRTVLVAMGQLIGTVDATLDGPGRRAILARLGVNVATPRLEDFGGSLVHNAVDYQLWYDASTRMIHFEASISLG
jgi:hypothetical protein